MVDAMPKFEFAEKVHKTIVACSAIVEMQQLPTTTATSHWKVCSKPNLPNSSNDNSVHHCLFTVFRVGEDVGVHTSLGLPCSTKEYH